MKRKYMIDIRNQIIMYTSLRHCDRFANTNWPNHTKCADHNIVLFQFVEIFEQDIREVNECW
jgi:hypothetical protein